MNISLFIESDHKVMLGKPILKGTRLTVELILKKLAEGASVDDLTSLYPNLTENHVRACLEFQFIMSLEGLMI